MFKIEPFIDRKRFIELGCKKYNDVSLSPNQLDDLLKKVISKWESFLNENDDLGLQLNRDYFVHEKNLSEVVLRSDQRALYYHTFHDIDEDEYKSWAIVCFWINTLKPFMVVNQKSNIYNCPNEMFSLYLILNVIRGSYENEFPDKKFNYPSKERIHDIVYDFKYCSLSREAMIAFVETLADTYGVGISYILSKSNSEK